MGPLRGSLRRGRTDRLLRPAGADRPRHGGERRMPGARPRPADRGWAAPAAAIAGAGSPRCQQDRRSRQWRLRRAGVEFDALGRRRAYWLYPVHPGEVAMFRRASLTSQPVPAASMLHLFDRLRPGQVRGVPWFAPVILKLRDLDEYDDAELVRKKIEACFAAFVTGADDEETLGSAATDADGRRVESFEPGMIEHLAPGKDVKFATPSAGGGYAEYMRVQLHAIAAGVGLTYELLTGDLSQVSAGLLEFRRRMEALQWQLPGLCRP